MLRYRITRHDGGRYFVLPAPLLAVPVGETYATRTVAQDTANWLNSLPCDDPQDLMGAPVACQPA